MMNSVRSERVQVLDKGFHRERLGVSSRHIAARPLGVCLSDPQLADVPAARLATLFANTEQNAVVPHANLRYQQEDGEASVSTW